METQKSLQIIISLRLLGSTISWHIKGLAIDQLIDAAPSEALFD
jgi:hypothetical protein